MPEVQGEPGSAPPGRSEVASGSAADAHEVLRAVPAGGEAEPIFHPEPVRIPFDTAPAVARESGPSLATTGALVLAAAGWSAAAARHPEPLAVGGAMVFVLAVGLDFLSRLRS